MGQVDKRSSSSLRGRRRPLSAPVAAGRRLASSSVLLALACCTPAPGDGVASPTGPGVPAIEPARGEGAEGSAGSSLSPSPPPSPQRPAPEVLRPAATVACPPGREHGCTILLRAPITGGEAELLYNDSGRPGPLSVDDEEILYVGSVTFSALVGLPLAASSPDARREGMRLVDFGGGRIKALARRGEDLLIAEESAVILASTTGAAPRKLAEESAYFAAIGGGWALWPIDRGGANGTGAIRGVRLDDGEAKPVTLIDAEARPQDLAADDDALYWLTWGEGTKARPGTLRRLAWGAAQPETLATDQLYPKRMTLDEANVYWVIAGEGGRALRAVARGGGEVRELIPATGSSSTRGNRDRVVAEGGWVFFNAAKAIWRVRTDGRDAARVLTFAEGIDGDFVDFDVEGGFVYVGARIYVPRERRRVHYL